ncbi:WXG100-like domain-containing protein [Streptomyces pinistramenti]|uniref:WXG100-like domain-containing protein n=1 Tax=Streptomyces pinistramenti TaxID=2884812 RepID=UPI001D05EA59|nr:PE-PGRS family protein [Streptomyces pinistramenti]MCB5911952.1 PE-PGRS family protein [Streptomyces pinistramenti]
MLPSEVDWILDLLGFQWPNVDEDKMREAAEGWSAFAASVRRYRSDGVTAANAVRGANSGEAVEAFDNAWKKFAGGDGHLDEVIAAAELLAFALNAVATIVMVLKLAVIAQLIALAIEIAAAQAAAPVTLGASEVGAAAATQTTRMIVRRILDEAEQKIVQKITEAVEKKAAKAVREIVVDLLKDAGKDMAKGVAQNLVSQGIENHYGARDGFSPQDALDAAGKAVTDKGKEIGKVGTGAYDMAQGAGKIAEGDFAEGGKQVWKGHEETVDGAKTIGGMVTKDRTPADEGTSGDEAGGGSGGGPAPAVRTATRAPAPPPAPTTRSGQDEADRARDAFG